MPSSTTVEDIKTIEPDHAGTEDSKSKPGASWKANEEHILPKNRLSIVHPWFCFRTGALLTRCAGLPRSNGMCFSGGY